MRHIVIGASGQVGGYLWRALGDGGEALGTYRSHPAAGQVPLDITDPDAVRALLTEWRPDVVWIPAALPDVDRCEREPEVSRQINVHGVQTVGRVARDLGARVVFFSTDYVFDGEAGPYGEDAAPRPIQVYGAHKREAEEFLLSEVPRSLVVRPAWIYSGEANPRNFVWRILQQVRAGQVVKAAVDQFSTPTPTHGLVEMSLKAVADGREGLLHLVGPERFSRLALTRRIAQLAGFGDAAIEPIATDSLKLPARRPLNGGLTTRYPEYQMPYTLTVDF